MIVASKRLLSSDILQRFQVTNLRRHIGDRTNIFRAYMKVTRGANAIIGT